MKNQLITDPAESLKQPYKYLGTFGMVWVTFLLLGMFTSIKTFTIFGLEYTVSIIAYPLTYIFADIFTEVYGYKRTRSIVWTGFFCLMITAVFAYIYSIIPASASFTSNDAFVTIFKSAPGIVFLVLAGFFSGELTNSFILAKMKLKTRGKLQELRFITSTFFGQIVDNTIFFTGLYVLLGFYTKSTVIPLIISSVLFCTIIEMIMVPITKRIIRFIKHREGIDTYDHGTNFNPFKIS